ncbi:MAG: GAF domain-containing protein [Desulfohalobiaceae bacterium]|nr:GAF domain-containing protein [Desulfohalobiaceae bacterium]
MSRLLERYPFQTALSLEPLIDYVRSTFAGKSDYWDKLLRDIDRAEGLQGAIDDLSVLDKHRDLIEKLLHQVFSALSWQTEAVAAVIPFSIRPVSMSPLFAELFAKEQGIMQDRLNLRQEDFDNGRVIRAYLFIAGQCYGIEEDLNYPIIRTVTDPESGLDRYYRMELDFRFVQAWAEDSHKVLSQEERLQVIDNLTAPEKLKEILPPEKFQLRGLTMIRAVDVTVSEVMSLLQRDLIDQEIMTTRKGFQQIQHRLRILFQKPGLVAGIAALKQDQVLLLNTGCDMDQNCIFADSRHIQQSEFKGSPFEKAATSGKILRFNNIHEDPWHLEKGEKAGFPEVKSMLIAPLMYQGQCIGTMDLGLSEACGFGPMSELLLDQIRPIFALTVKKSLDELDNQVQRIIKQECTAIHPAVEWRFRKAAFQHLEDINLGRSSEIEPIVFQDVYSLYGVSDIRGSSLERNRAIAGDLKAHLNLAQNVLLAANQIRPMLLVHELIQRIEHYRTRIGSGLDSGDDLSLIDFLAREVEPVFSLLKGFGPAVQAAVDKYQAALDPNLGTVYSLRKDFEDSVSVLNDNLSACLDQEEAELQEILPHYFERHRSDGLDYLMYIGQSLLENGGFHPAYLKDFRIWQLKMACTLAGLAEDLKSSLKIPLDVAHLVLVQNNPLSIRFRYDEKRFDVDGAYDVRQEIIKSRLDKAEIRETGERLTQPGRIAVIYSSRSEGLEVKQHIDYLRLEGYFKKETEQLRLADLPGVQGLKALRAEVDLESRALAEKLKGLAA